MFRWYSANMRMTITTARDVGGVSCMQQLEVDISKPEMITWEIVPTEPGRRANLVHLQSSSS